MAELTVKQQRFCQEYLVDFNGTQAAIRSGYSQKTACAIGVENLRKPLIKEEITRLMAEIVGDTNKIMFENIQFWNEVRQDPDANKSDRLKASELLGKFAKMFTDRIEHSGEVNVHFDSVVKE